MDEFAKYAREEGAGVGRLPPGAAPQRLARPLCPAFLAENHRLNRPLRLPYATGEYNRAIEQGTTDRKSVV